MQRQMLKGACNYCIQFTQPNLVKLLIIANSLKYKIRPTLEHQLLVQPKRAMISFDIMRTWAAKVISNLKYSLKNCL